MNVRIFILLRCDVSEVESVNLVEILKSGRGLLHRVLWRVQRLSARGAVQLLHACFGILFLFFFAHRISELLTGMEVVFLYLCPLIILSI